MLLTVSTGPIASRTLSCIPWHSMPFRLYRRACLLLLFPALGLHAQLIPADKLNLPDAPALLLYFVASDCPVSNRYFPEMERLASRFSVPARYIYPNTNETLAEAQHHQSVFNASPSDARTDPSGELVHLTGAHTTPEAVLLTKRGTAWNVAYRGRIDDRYIHIGLERGQVEHHDLEAALTAVAAGKPAPPPTGPAVGCAIVAAGVPRPRP